MDIFLQDPTAIPLPPDEVRIVKFTATPWPDKRRVRVYLEITPFQKRPNGELVIFDEEGEEVASLAIIETITPRMEFTMHLRGDKASGRYLASATIYYLQSETEFPSFSAQRNQETDVSPEHLVVDSREVEFEIHG